MESKSRKGQLDVAAATLTAKLQPFAPTQILYIETGGAPLGKRIAADLRIPAVGVDIRYPFSRISSPVLRWVLFPLKELVYKLTLPSLRTQSPLLFEPAARIALVDDTASSGKTLRLAVDHLLSQGILRDRIRIAVYRAGRRAASLVDFAVKISQ